MSATVQQKRGPKPVLRNKVLLKLKANKLTSGELGVSTTYMTILVENGIVRVVKREKQNEGAGRPANVYSLTQRGNAFATSLARRSVSA